MTNWKETQIWKKLEDIKSDTASKVRAFLESDFCMDKIEIVLNSASTTPKDFTLHDADHSFRVTERMWEIIPVDTQDILSEYELAFLLLSAYLHDIGMSPEIEKVNNHYICLNTNTKAVLSQSEKQDFQKWLDEQGEQIDLEKDELRDEDKSAELVTYYCRFKHNDWSEDWITKNFKDIEIWRYTNWLKDLVNICKSHHYGFEKLKSEDFNPLRIHGKVIHKRYIAMCLRLADVIEIDPERAPEVLLKHRNIIEGSISHWLKEKFTSIDIINYCISITANPTKAFVHKAIVDIADQIEHETNLCNMLKGEIPLSNIFPSNDLKHEWKVLPSIYRGIKESGNYEFIDGTFKPNSKKLLQLLAGTGLYGKPIIAIREIIQNALDAIKVQIAYKVIEDNLSTKEQVALLEKSFSIELSILKQAEDYWIICKDNGVGMDKEIIMKSFLVGGAAKRHELLELERRCHNVGHKLEVTGQFGIGVLSYFMIADKIIINTKKSHQSGYHESNGWEFEINGLSDFGELRKVDSDTPGTIVKLRIRKELLDQIIDENSIVNLLENTLNRIPCNFRFTPLERSVISYLPGWCKDLNYYKKKIIEQLNISTIPDIKSPEEFISEEKQSIIQTSNTRRIEFIEKISKSVDFISHEGFLKNGNGYFRIHIPVFENEKGDSFAFFFENLNKEKICFQRINEGFLFYPINANPVISWKGIAIKNGLNYNRAFPYKNCFIELDLINDKSFNISVSRLEINYNTQRYEMLQEIQEKIDEIILTNKKRFSNSIYSFFNHRIASYLEYKPQKMFWTFDNGYKEDIVKFEKVKFPLIFDISTEIGNPEDELYNKKDLYRVESLKGCGSDYRSKYFSINKYDYKFDRAVFHNYYNYRISFLITSKFKSNNKYSYIGNSAKFPAQWQKLLCVRGYDEKDIVLNENSTLFKLITQKDFQLAKDFFAGKNELDSDKGNLLIKTKGKALCFMLYLITLNEISYWHGVVKNNQVFVKKLWQRIFGNESDKLYFFHDGISNTQIVEISINSWTIISGTKDIIKHLPIPDEEWRIENKEIKPAPNNVYTK